MRRAEEMEKGNTQSEKKEVIASAVKKLTRSLIAIVMAMKFVMPGDMALAGDKNVDGLKSSAGISGPKEAGAKNTFTSKREDSDNLIAKLSEIRHASANISRDYHLRDENFSSRENSPIDGGWDKNMAIDWSYGSERISSPDLPIAEGIQIVDKFDKTKPTILFIHGVTGSSKNFSKFFDQYQGAYNIAFFNYEYTNNLRSNASFFTKEFAKFTQTNKIDDPTVVAHSYGNNILMQAVIDTDASTENMFKNTPIVQLAPLFPGSEKATNASTGIRKWAMVVWSLIGGKDYGPVSSAADPEGEIVFNLCDNYDVFASRVKLVQIMGMTNDSHAPDETSSDKFKKRYDRFVPVENRLKAPKGQDGHTAILRSPEVIEKIAAIASRNKRSENIGNRYSKLDPEAAVVARNF